MARLTPTTAPRLNPLAVLLTLGYIGVLVYTTYLLYDGAVPGKKGDGDEGEEEEEEREARSVREVKWYTRHLYSQKKLASRYVEICVSDIESCAAAIHGGATSLELCANRLEGGVTPSLGFVQQAVALCQSTNVAVHVLLRPRPGDFVYSAQEFDLIVRDVCLFRDSGVDGVVCGILTDQGNVDVSRMRIVRNLADGMMLTFHRAFDVCSLPSGSVEGPDLDVEAEYWTVMELIGCDRLLTSGRAASAVLGASVLKRLVQEESRINSLHQAAAVAGTDTVTVSAAQGDAVAAAGGWLPSIKKKASAKSGNDGAADSNDIPSWARGDKITVAAAGLTPTSIKGLILSSGVQGVHLGSGVCVSLGDARGNSTELSVNDGRGVVRIGSAPAPLSDSSTTNATSDSCYSGVSSALVEAAVAAANEAWTYLDRGRDDASVSDSENYDDTTTTDVGSDFAAGTDEAIVNLRVSLESGLHSTSKYEGVGVGVSGISSLSSSTDISPACAPDDEQAADAPKSGDAGTEVENMKASVESIGSQGSDGSWLLVDEFAAGVAGGGAAPFANSAAK